MHMNRAACFASLAVVVVCAAACGGPSLEVTGYQVAPVNLGKTRGLVLTDAEGSRAAVGAAIDVALVQITERGWFRAEDGTDLGRLEVDARGPLLTDGALEAGVAYLRLDVVQADAVTETQVDSTVDEVAGNEIEVVSEHATATVVIHAILASGDAEVIVTNLETEGVAEADGPGINDIALLDSAMEEAVRRVLAEITPATTTQRLELDDRDARQKEIVADAVGGNVSAALDEEALVLADSPSPAAYYNQGVMLDHLGVHRDALASYEGARVGADTELLAKIDEAVAGCRARIAARDELGL